MRRVLEIIDRYFFERSNLRRAHAEDYEKSQENVEAKHGRQSVDKGLKAWHR